jgi:hypothetical protein
MAKISISIPDELLKKIDKEKGSISRSKFISDMLSDKSITTARVINIGFDLNDIETLLDKKFEELKR